jgi:hypothetical protein
MEKMPRITLIKSLASDQAISEKVFYSDNLFDFDG